MFLLLQPKILLQQPNVLLIEPNILLLKQNIFVIPILTNDVIGITKPFFPCTEKPKRNILYFKIINTYRNYTEIMKGRRIFGLSCFSALNVERL